MSTLITMQLAQERYAAHVRDLESAASVRRAIADRRGDAQGSTETTPGRRGSSARRRTFGFGTHHALHA